MRRALRVGLYELDEILAFEGFLVFEIVKVGLHIWDIC